MRTMILFLVVLATGCAASVERDCETTCSTRVLCPETAELWHCEVPERGWDNTFCDFGGDDAEPLQVSCMRACFDDGACEAPALETAVPYVCRCVE